MRSLCSYALILAALCIQCVHVIFLSHSHNVQPTTQPVNIVRRVSRSPLRLIFVRPNRQLPLRLESSIEIKPNMWNRARVDEKAYFRILAECWTAQLFRLHADYILRSIFGISLFLCFSLRFDVAVSRRHRHFLAAIDRCAYTHYWRGSPAKRISSVSARVCAHSPCKNVDICAVCLTIAPLMHAENNSYFLFMYLFWKIYRTATLSLSRRLTRKTSVSVRVRAYTRSGDDVVTASATKRRLRITLRDNEEKKIFSPTIRDLCAKTKNKKRMNLEEGELSQSKRADIWIIIRNFTGSFNFFLLLIFAMARSWPVHTFDRRAGWVYVFFSLFCFKQFISFDIVTLEM